MKELFISADIEGTTGIASWDEASPSKPDYQYFQNQMTREVAAACEGALAAGYVLPHSASHRNWRRASSRAVIPLSASLWRVRKMTRTGRNATWPRRGFVQRTHWSPSVRVGMRPIA